LVIKQVIVSQEEGGEIGLLTFRLTEGEKGHWKNSKPPFSSEAKRASRNWSGRGKKKTLNVRGCSL